MHLINLIVTYLYRKYGAPLHNFFENWTRGRSHLKASSSVFGQFFNPTLSTAIPGALGMSCDAMDVVEPGFGETYTSSEDTVEDMDNSFNVNMQYKVRVVAMVS